MTEPTRLLADPNAPDEATALLRELSAPLPPSPAKQLELSRQLAALTTPAVVAGTTTALWVKAALVLGTVGLAVSWGVLHSSSRSLPSTATPAISSVIPAPAVPAPAPAEPAPDQAVRETPRELPSAAANHPRLVARDNLAREEALLEQARQFASSSPSRSLALLQQHQHSFPAGQLSAERMFLSVDVLTRLGKPAAARRQADALIRAFPNSVYAAQLKARSSTP